MSLNWLAVIALVAVPALGHAECGWLLMVPPSYWDNKTRDFVSMSVSVDSMGTRRRPRTAAATSAAIASSRAAGASVYSMLTE